MIRRRDFITLLGSAAAWPLAVRAQQGQRVRRIGVLVSGDENDPFKTWVSAFTQALADLGWTDGRNVWMDLRWAGSDINRMRALAQELVGLQPDIILTHGVPATAAVQRETRTIPIVFANAGDGVAHARKDDWDRPRLPLDGSGRWGRGCQDDVGLQADQLLRKRSYPIDISAEPPKVHPHVPALGPTQVRECLRERGNVSLPHGIAFVAHHEHADAPHAVALLRSRHHRPRRRTTDPRNELPPSHP